MAAYPDIARFGYDSSQAANPLGFFNTPGVGDISGYGASNPVAAAQQQAAAIGGVDPITGYSGASTTFPGMPGAGGVTGGNSGGFFGGSGIDVAKLALGGLSTIGSLWTAWQANKLAKDQFKFTKDITNANLANQISAYNTSLEDKARSRSAQENQAPGTAEAYIAGHKLADRQI